MSAQRARIDLEEAAATHPQRPAPAQRLQDDEAADAAGAAPPLAAALRRDAPAGRGFDPLRAATLLGLQQTIGNRAVQRLLQRAASPSTPATAPTAPGEADLAARIRSAGSGQPLPSQVQRDLEAGVGADLSAVRVHTDAAADCLSRAVDATSFTTGSDIFFRAGAYAPTSSDGLQVLAHEATHVVQQAAGPVAGTPAPGGVSISDPGDPYEQAATQAAASLAGGQHDQGAETVQRQPAAGAPGQGAYLQRITTAAEFKSQTKLFARKGRSGEDFKGFVRSLSTYENMVQERASPGRRIRFLLSFKGELNTWLNSKAGQESSRRRNVEGLVGELEVRISQLQRVRERRERRLERERRERRRAGRRERQAVGGGFSDANVTTADEPELGETMHTPDEATDDFGLEDGHLEDGREEESDHTADEPQLGEAMKKIDESTVPQLGDAINEPDESADDLGHDDGRDEELDSTADESQRGDTTSDETGGIALQPPPRTAELPQDTFAGSLGDPSRAYHARMLTDEMRKEEKERYQPGSGMAMATWGGSKLPVKYIDDPDERASYELKLEKGSHIFYWGGEPIDTTTMKRQVALGGATSNTEHQRAIFVMTVTGAFYVADEGAESTAGRENTEAQYRFNHSTLVAGEPIAAAGEMWFEQGKLKGISDKSGHYRPGAAYTLQALQHLADLGLDVSGVVVERVGPVDANGEQTYLTSTAGELMSKRQELALEDALAADDALKKGWIVTAANKLENAFLLSPQLPSPVVSYEKLAARLVELCTAKLIDAVNQLKEWVDDPDPDVSKDQIETLKNDVALVRTGLRSAAVVAPGLAGAKAWVEADQLWDTLDREQGKKMAERKFGGASAAATGLLGQFMAKEAPASIAVKKALEKAFREYQEAGPGKRRFAVASAFLDAYNAGRAVFVEVLREELKAKGMAKETIVTILDDGWKKADEDDNEEEVDALFELYQLIRRAPEAKESVTKETSDSPGDGNVDEFDQTLDDDSDDD